MTDHEQHGRHTVPEGFRVPVYGLFVLGVLYTMYLAHQVFLPITLAVLASLLLAPPVAALARRGIPKVIGAMVMLTLLVGVVGGVGAYVAGPIMDWMEEAPEGIGNLLFSDHGLHDAYQRMTDSARQVEEAVEEFADEDAVERTTVVLESESWRGQLMVGARNNAVAIALALTLSYFLLVSGESLVRNLVSQLATRERRRTVLRVIRDSQREIARYLAVITMSNSAVGVLTALMLWGLGLPSPVVWGVIATLLRFVPYLGVLVTTVALAIISAISMDDPLMMMAAPVGYLLLSSLVGFVLEPYIHGYRMDINPIIIFLGIFFWGWLWGAIGVLLAVPLMTVVMVLLRQIDGLRPLYRIIAR
ncbi:AI-2E family transporter [Aquisalimonas sp.]|uniref:AI-2E family transporter n=1 Tax=unclassified Aquisalimonas TaxID=2644645 RepID=UPI0025B87C5F|nr:AI-2E family transporter [Aquisalimonas sp.]